MTEKTNRINSKIGEIIGGFVRTEFLISNIAFELGYTPTAYHFFAKSKTGEKLRKFKEKISESTLSQKVAIVACIDRIDKIREERNIIVHSLILINTKDSNDFRTYYYRLDNEDLLREFGSYKLDDLDDLSRRLSDAHNELFSLHYENKNGFSTSK